MEYYTHTIKSLTSSGARTTENIWLSIHNINLEHYWCMSIEEAESENYNLPQTLLVDKIERIGHILD